MEGYYINSSGEKTIIPSVTKVLDISYRNIVEIVCNRELETLYCHNNLLTKLTLNNKLETLFCNSNKLKELKLNDKLEYLSCRINIKLDNINPNTYITLHE